MGESDRVTSCRQEVNANCAQSVKTRHLRSSLDGCSHPGTVPHADLRGARPAAPGSTSSLRTANQHRVLDVLRQDAGVFTQAELARATGLAPATVSSIVRELAEGGLVDAAPGSGRRGAAVRLSRAGAVAGIDFGHSHVAVALGDLSGRVVAEYRRRPTVSASPDALTDARRCSTDSASGRRPSGRSGWGYRRQSSARSSCPPASSRAGRASTRASSPKKPSGCPYVENDANLGAVAEHRFGAGQGHDSTIFVKTSSGVGAASSWATSSSTAPTARPARSAT